MKRIAILSLLVAGGAVSSLTAQEQWETSVSLAKNEETTGPAFGFQTIRYNSPVTLGADSPWKETAFAERIGFLDASLHYLKTDFTVGPLILERNPPIEVYPEITLDSTIKSLDLGYVHRSPESPHAFEFGVGVIEEKSEFLEFVSGWVSYPYLPPNITPPSYSIRESKARSFFYGAGYDYYLADNWTLGGSVALEETSLQDTYIYTLRTKRIWDLGLENWVNLEAGITYRDPKLSAPWRFADAPVSAPSIDDMSYFLEGSFYFSRRTGVGIKLNYRDIEGSDGYDVNEFTYRIFVDHYFSKSVFASLYFEQFEYDSSFESINQRVPEPSTVGANFGFRF